MNKEELIVDYLNGELSASESAELEKSISTDSTLQALLNDYNQLHQCIDKDELIQPGASMKARFEQHLNEAMSKQSTGANVVTMNMMRYIKQGAAVAAILVIGALLGINLNQRSFINKVDSDMNALYTQMSDQMQSNSVSGRIQAVQVSQQFETTNDKVLTTLIVTMMDDNSPNVRLAAADALARYADEPVVRESMIKQLSTEEDPFVLISLIETLSDHKDEKAVETLVNMTQSDLTPKFIKDQAHMGLMKFEKL